MEETKKRRRPNLFDILFIVLILAVAAVAWYVSREDGQIQAETRTRTYLLELSDMDESMARYVAVGDKVKDNVKNFDMGAVTAIEVVQATGQVVDEEARVVRQSPREDRVLILLTVEAETTETNTTVSTVGGYSLRVGKSVSCTVGQLTSPGYILAVER